MRKRELGNISTHFEFINFYDGDDCELWWLVNDDTIFGGSFRTNTIQFFVHFVDRFVTIQIFNHLSVMKTTKNKFIFRITFRSVLLNRAIHMHIQRGQHLKRQ